MTAPVLLLDDIVCHAGGRRVLAVERFAVSPGEAVAVFGPNGAGKTTLLHVAALLAWPTAGSVAIRGERATPQNAATLRRSLSVVFQEPLLFDVNVLANAAAGLRFQGAARAEAERHASKWLECFGVAHLARRRARTLSGGEASRVALARAFATEPAILLLDEPFSSLDAPTRASLLPLLRDRVRDTGAAAVLVTHDLDEALAFADRIALMQAGRIVACGAAPELIARPPTKEVAELLGIETILPATVAALAGNYVDVTLDPAVPPIRVRAPLATLLRRGQRMTMTLPAGATRALRPDDDPPAGWNLLPGIVAAATSHSLGTRLLVRTPVPFVVLDPWRPASCGWRCGERVVVAFPPEAAHLIPDGT